MQLHDFIIKNIMYAFYLPKNVIFITAYTKYIQMSEKKLY